MSESETYRLALAESTRHHDEAKTFSGRFLRKHGPALKGIIERLGCASILDYGCGKGEQYNWLIPELGTTLEQYWGVPVTKFDPAYKPFSAQPNGNYDLVICTHVLGSIPKSDLRWVVDRLYGHASKVLYVVEKIGPVKKHIFSRPDLMPLGWDENRWLDALARNSEIEVHFLAHRRDGEKKVTRHWQAENGRWRGGEEIELTPYLQVMTQ